MRKGAAERGQTLTEFLIATACTEAEAVLADQRVFLLPQDRWEEFIRALDAPPNVNPNLRKLFAEPSVLEKVAGQERSTASATSPTRPKLQQRPKKPKR